jgi:NAD(P)-dependent dehydrogenase (short-subunit alcohol dehydrogenase family)
MPEFYKVAIVTGASQGLGEGIVKAYRARGWRVVALSRSIKASDDPGVLAVAGDVGDPATGKRAIAEAVATFGRIDSLVNNAGVFIASPFTEYTEEQYRQKVHVHLDGFFYMTQAVVPELLKQGGGLIVQITTTLVDQARSEVPSVIASLTKGGLAAATRSLAVEYASRGIRANAISPGCMKTPMHPPEAQEMLAGLHPVGRMGEASDIGQAVMYLEDATFVTGEILHVDGGMIAGV